MAEDLGSLLGAARRDLEPASLQALADAVRVAARSDAGRAEAGALPHLVELLASALGDARLSTAWPSTAGAMANLAANSDVNRDALRPPTRSRPWGRVVGEASRQGPRVRSQIRGHPESPVVAPPRWRRGRFFEQAE
jgi:hypothetical protein